MKPSEICKSAGLSGLNELSEITEVPVNTLINWCKTRPIVFKMLVERSAQIKNVDKNRLLIKGIVK